MRYASYDGANWSIETPMTRASSLSYSSLDLALNGTGTPHIVYFDDNDNALYIAIKSEGVWSTSKIRDNAGYYTTGRQSSAIAIEP